MQKPFISELLRAVREQSIEKCKKHKWMGRVSSQNHVVNVLWTREKGMNSCANL